MSYYAMMYFPGQKKEEKLFLEDWIEVITN